MNWLKWLTPQPDLATSILHDEHTFYQAFIHDLKRSKTEVIIECPFITSSRVEMLIPIFKGLLDRKVKIHIITRDPAEHDEFLKYQATNEILACYELGVKITMLKGNFHRKLAIIDRKIIWEGSLNILSQNSSREIMRRIESKKMSHEILRFLSFKK